MGRGRKGKIFKIASKKGTLHQFYMRKKSGRPKVIYNSFKYDDELSSKLRQYRRSVLKPKTIEQNGSKKSRNSGASKSQSSEQKSKISKELKKKM